MICQSLKTDRSVTPYRRRGSRGRALQRCLNTPIIPVVLWVGTLLTSLSSGGAIVSGLFRILQGLLAIGLTVGIAWRLMRPAPRLAQELGWAAVTLFLFVIGRDVATFLYPADTSLLEVPRTGFQIAAMLGLLITSNRVRNALTRNALPFTGRLDVWTALSTALYVAWVLRIDPIVGTSGYQIALQRLLPWLWFARDVLSSIMVWIAAHAFMSGRMDDRRLTVRVMATIGVLIGLSGLLNPFAPIASVLPWTGFPDVLIATAYMLWACALMIPRRVERNPDAARLMSEDRSRAKWQERFPWDLSLLWLAFFAHVHQIMPGAGQLLDERVQATLVLAGLMLGFFSIRHIVSEEESARRGRGFVQEQPQRRASEAELQAVRGDLAQQLRLRTDEVLEAHSDLRREMEGRIRAEEALRIAEARLRYTAVHDPLTDLPNRAVLLDRIDWAIDQSRTRPGFGFALVLLDIDHFRLIMDSLGYLIGDQVLVLCAGRFQTGLRSCDTLARISADEFAVLVEDVRGEDDVRNVVARLRTTLADPLDIQGQRLYVTASVSIVFGAALHETANDVLSDAEVTMYHAKSVGKTGLAIYHPRMRTHLVDRLALDSELRQAMERQELFLQYQPIFDLRTRRVVSFEALVRWRHPYRGLVPPSEFIAIAENNGTIVSIGRWVLQEAIHQLARWREQCPAAQMISMAVNLSAHQFGEAHLVEHIARLLEEARLEPEALKIEVTETALIDDAETVLSAFLQLRQLGVQLQIDDFGTGYSSLHYLQRFPISSLKIDRSFINTLESNPEALEIVRSIVNLAHVLGLTVVAEGIESLAQFEQVKALDCEFGQGFLFSRALDPALALAMVVERHAGPPSLTEAHLLPAS